MIASTVFNRRAAAVTTCCGQSIEVAIVPTSHLLSDKHVMVAPHPASGAA